MHNREDAEVSELIKQRATRYSAPPELLRSIRGAYEPARQTPARRRSIDFGWRWLPLGGAFLAGALAMLFAMPMLQSRGGQGADIEQLVDGHIRSLVADHLTDVVSADQRTVKPWFAGKLDFTPQVRDTSAAGFPLAGGRLDVVAGHIVAAVVYRRQQHVINVFEMPGPTAASPPTLQRTVRGFNVIRWSKEGMSCWAVSDLNTAELKVFANSFWHEVSL